MWETWVQTLGWEDPLEKGKAYPLHYCGLENSMECVVHRVAKSWEDPLQKAWQPTPVLLSGKFHGGRSLVGYSPWDRRESNTTEQLHWFHWLLSTINFFSQGDGKPSQAIPWSSGLTILSLSIFHWVLFFFMRLERYRRFLWQ